MTRRSYLLATTLTAMLFAASSAAIVLLDPRPWLIWNASASAPIGLYRIEDDRHPKVGELVAVLPPDHLAAWLARRDYLPRGLPLLKHVAALPGQQVCRFGDELHVDGRFAVRARSHDSAARPLPVWQGCRTLAQGEVVLLNPAAPDSMDSRYFGPLPTSTLIGRAQPILTRATPQAPLLWGGSNP
ncbi:S26 family signal peptidase [Sphingopyxis sp. R3-92]|uniref:S26 family signal peptidase n=1 Tax=Sphingopyxis sp. R3-92 TaxID=3158553 RepID=UPI003EE4DC9E